MFLSTWFQSDVISIRGSDRIHLYSHFVIIVLILSAIALYF